MFDGRSAVCELIPLAASQGGGEPSDLFGHFSYDIHSAFDFQGEKVIKNGGSYMGSVRQFFCREYGCQLFWSQIGVSRERLPDSGFPLRKVLVLLTAHRPLYLAMSAPCMPNR